MEEGAGMLMVDDVNMYIPFLHPTVVSRVNKVFCITSRTLCPKNLSTLLFFE